jgi:hypothetical protein
MASRVRILDADGFATALLDELLGQLGDASSGYQNLGSVVSLVKKSAATIAKIQVCRSHLLLYTRPRDPC